jgi:nucleoid-associated protein YgaU
MDRGVKVAIFVASIVSLSLGLIWDQVLNQARNAVQQVSVDELGPEIMQAVVGAPDIRRQAPPEAFEAQPPVNLPDPQAPAEEQRPEAPPPVERWQEYTVQHGDSWWRLAHVTFKDLGLATTDIEKANPGVVLRPGIKLRIPPNKEALESSPPPARSGSPQAQAPATALEYTVQEGDSWWRIAHVTFKELGKTTQQWEEANPGVRLRPGVKIRIPD